MDAALPSQGVTRLSRGDGVVIMAVMSNNIVKHGPGMPRGCSERDVVRRLDQSPTAHLRHLALRARGDANVDIIFVRVIQEADPFLRVPRGASLAAATPAAACKHPLR